MSFLFPNVLWALFALSIPIIVHLFFFRRYKTEFFSNVMFLRKIEKKNNSTRTIKNWLILLFRLICFAALILAFAQAFIPNPNINQNTNIQNNAVCIYIDNSFSMESEGENGKILEAAKNSALKIATAYTSKTSFYFLDNSYSAKYQHAVNKEQLLNFISGLEPYPKAKNFSEITQRFKTLIAEQNLSNSTIYVISDFQHNFFDSKQLNTDSLLNLKLINLSNQTINNLLIDTCYFPHPGRIANSNDEIIVSIKNFSNQNYKDVPVKLFINDTLKAISSITISANKESELNIKYQNPEKSYVYGRVEISDYPITYDNTYNFAYKTASKFNVICVYDKNKNQFIESAFASDSVFSISFQKTNEFIPGSLNSISFIILDGVYKIDKGFQTELNEYISKGGKLLIVPNMKAEIADINLLLSSFSIGSVSELLKSENRIENINYNHLLYKNLFTEKAERFSFPNIKLMYKYNLTNSISEDIVLSTSNKIPFLISNKFNGGEIYWLSSDLDLNSNDFMKSILFTSSLYNMVIYSNDNKNIAYKVGIDNSVEIKKSEDYEKGRIEIKALNKDYSFVPGFSSNTYNTMLNMYDNILNEGIYQIIQNDKIVLNLAYNYDRSESEPKFYTVDQIQELIDKSGNKNISLIKSKIDTLSAEIADIETGKKLWKWFLLIALIALAGEILTIKLIK